MKLNNIIIIYYLLIMLLQKEILNLNQYACRKVLTLPKSISKLAVDDNTMMNKFFSHLSQKKTSFNSSTDVLHPNLINYLIKNNICDVKRRDNYCYLENSKNEKINISKQNWFGYQLVESLKNKNKKIINNYFDKDGYINNLKIEKWSKNWNGIKRFRRIDFMFDIGDEDTERFIAVEFLEDHHIDELINQNQYQSVRIVDILFGEYKDKICHFIFVWDKLWNDKEYQKKIVNHLYKKIKDFNDIDNEEKYIVNILNQDLNNKKMSKLIFDSYKNENNCVLKIDDIEKLFKIKNKESVKNKFTDIVNEFNTTDINDIDFEFDSDSDVESSDTITTDNYYSTKGNKLLLSNKGLMSYLKETNKEDCESLTGYKMIHEFPDRLGRSAYNSAKKIMELNLKLKEELIYGLDDIV